MPSSAGKAISKSQFKLGLDCIQKLRHAREGLPQASQDNDMMRLLQEGGAAVEALVRASEPGRLVGGFGPAALAESREAIVGALAAAVAGSTTALYEVTIAHAGFFARIDLLRVRPDCIDLVEIKSSSVTSVAGRVADGEFLTDRGRVRSAWIPYIQDLAFQRELLQQWLAAHRHALPAGATSRTSPRLLLLDKAGRATSDTVLCPANYRSRYEITRHGIRAAVDFVGPRAGRELLVEVPMDTVVESISSDSHARSPVFAGCALVDCMEAMRKIVDEGVWPDAGDSLDSACKKCEFRVREGLESGFTRCWGEGCAGVQHHVLTTNRLGSDQCRAVLAEAGRRATVMDIDEHALKPTQHMQRRSLELSCPIVTQAFAADPMGAMGLAGVQGSVHFVDFEASIYPIPARNGGMAFEFMPFQFEAHRMPRVDAGLETRERLEGFLDLGSVDPRRRFLDELRRQLGPSGPIFHWHHFERTVLNALKKGFMEAPAEGDEERHAFIDALVGPTVSGGGRLVNMLPIAEKACYHPDFGGSYSIKKVVPVAWCIPGIRAHFAAGHGAVGDPDQHAGASDPYDGLPPPPKAILEAVGGLEAARELAGDDGGDGEAGAMRNGGMAMLAYHYVRLFGGAGDPEVVAQFRRYCRLDSAAMVMVFALLRDHVRGWRVV